MWIFMKSIILWAKNCHRKLLCCNIAVFSVLILLIYEAHEKYFLTFLRKGKREYLLHLFSSVPSVHCWWIFSSEIVVILKALFVCLLFVYLVIFVRFVIGFVWMLRLCLLSDIWSLFCFFLIDVHLLMNVLMYVRQVCFCLPWVFAYMFICSVCEIVLFITLFY